MIKLEDGELLSLLTTPLKDSTDVIALSYALKMGAAKLLECARRTRMYAAIDTLPEWILDRLAVDLRSPYYETDMEIFMKREIVKKSIQWHMKAGTVSTVEEMVSTIFGEGELTEWFDFEGEPGEPGTFDITASADATFDMLDRFTRIIDNVKNVRSHLRRVIVKGYINQNGYYGGVYFGVYTGRPIEQANPLQEPRHFAGATIGYIVADSVPQREGAA